MESLARIRKQIVPVIGLLAAFSFAVNLLLLVMPLYMLQVYDRVLTSRSMDTLTFLSLIALSALAVLGMLEAVRAVLASRAAARLETTLGSAALRLSLDRSRQGNSDIQPVRDLAAIRSFISSRLIFALLDLPFAPLFIGILFIIHPTLFLLTVAGAVVLVALAWFNQNVTSTASQTASHQQSEAMLTAETLARNAHTVQAMGMAAQAISVWGGHNAASLNAQAQMDRRNALLSGLSRAIRMGLQIAIIGVGAWLVLREELTAGMIFAASIISGRGLQPIDQIIGGWKQAVTAWNAWRSLETALTQAGDEPKRTLMNPPQGDIALDGVLVFSKAGVGAAPIINRISFTLKPGDVLGVVGPSGSGKSTLARLMVGAQMAQSGTVRIDGTEIQHWNNAQLGQHIGYLGQEVELLPGTVAQNIARLANVPDDRAVLEAAQRAHVHELIQNLPDGYETMIGPGGLGLSGGQRQRVGLARAFYGNPQIMVLDEPNANLDDEGEMALHQAILNARKLGVTMVIITQRKQVLNVVDHILRLHKGSLDFFGTRQAFVQALQTRRTRQPAANANPPQRRATDAPSLAPELQRGHMPDPMLEPINVRQSDLTGASSVSADHVAQPQERRRTEEAEAPTVPVVQPQTIRKAQ